MDTDRGGVGRAPDPLHAARVVLRTVRDVTRLVVPVECPGCGLWDVILCGPCAGSLGQAPTRCEWDAPRLDRMDGQDPLPVWRVARYAGPVRGMVGAWKDGGRADLTSAFVAAVQRAAVELGPVLGAACAGEVLHVVPVPSSPGARRRRGADLVSLLAHGVVEGLRVAGLPARVAPVLAIRRGRRDQVGLGARARGRNTSGAVHLRRGQRDGWTDAPRLHLLVDDVVTTGSTLATCGDALAEAGGLVLGAVVLAATPSPSSPIGRLLKAPRGD